MHQEPDIEEIRATLEYTIQRYLERSKEYDQEISELNEEIISLTTRISFIKEAIAEYERSQKEIKLKEKEDLKRINQELKEKEKEDLKRINQELKEKEKEDLKRINQELKEKEDLKRINQELKEKEEQEKINYIETTPFEERQNKEILELIQSLKNDKIKK